MRLSPHQTALFCKNRGYEVDKFYKFKIRPNEKISGLIILIIKSIKFYLKKIDQERYLTYKF
ncbi:hypothetical protein CHL9426_02715 [Campylobacter hyointestinalis subsp. lawsonii]|nr:hypothetical protein CHL9752_02750 [Campylobacter hyointestinalis subsp. lawsonii]RAZ39614.1 hypothetical protein CHL9426_02715 [Campylobacter hyointestinalis subsp. lawsonii]